MSSYSPTNDLPQVLYRLYDAAGALLYIGVTYDFEMRMRMHLSTTSSLESRVQGWEGIQSRYHSHTLEPYANAREARVAEKAAIKAEAPELNWLHNVANIKARAEVAA